jgi:hypothetical protein
MKFPANTVRLLCVAVGCAAVAPGAFAALTINYVGSASLADYRTTSVPKPLDADGDNVFGSTGCVFYATDVNGNSSAGRVAAADPFEYESGTITTRGFVPEWLSLFNNGQNNIAASYASYPLIDDLSAPPGPSVPDVQLGLALRLPNPFGTEGSMVDIRFGEGTPAGGVRLGVVCFATTGDAVDVIRLTSNAGENSFATRAGGAPVIIYFFDISAIESGESVTLHLTKNPGTGGNANVAYVGLTFDVLPSVPPNVNITQPADQSGHAAPLTTVISANVVEASGPVTNVTFYVNGLKLADAPLFPYSVAWNAVPAGNYSLLAVATDATGLSGTSSVVKVTVTNWPPTIASASPPPGTLTNLTQITVAFSKAVQGVNAADFLINDIPSTNVSGSGTTYIFQFAQPAYGPVAITWTETHGITDTFSPPTAFDRLGPGATWGYYLRGTLGITAASVINGIFTLCWDSYAGERYRVEKTSSLPATNWTQVMTNIIATGTNTCASGATPEPQTFYRIVAY